MADVCTDGRFEIIARAKQAILESTNIDTSPDEMKVLDNFLFRCWQMDWLDKYDKRKTNVGQWIPCSERLPERNECVLVQTCWLDEEFKIIAAYRDTPEWTDKEVWRVENGYAGNDEVIAWMPLPDPYKEGETI